MPKLHKPLQVRAADTSVRSTETRRRLTGTQVVANVCTGLLAVGSFGPWATLGPFSAGGLDNGNDGWLTLSAAVICAFLLWRLHTSNGHKATISVALIVFLTAIATFIGIYDVVTIAGDDALDVGWGLWIVTVSAIVLAISAIKIHRDGPRDDESLAP